MLDLSSILGALREAALPPSLQSLALIDDRARTVEYLISHTSPQPCAWRACSMLRGARVLRNARAWIWIRPKN